MINLLVDVHLCPVVPTAPNTNAGITILRSASGVRITALLPPNSSNDFPNLSPTTCPTDFPILVEPVAETNGILLSEAINLPKSASPMIKEQIPPCRLLLSNTSAIIFWHAIAHKGAFSDGFQIHTSPQIQANAVFQAQTATGKLNAEIIPTIPSG